MSSEKQYLGELQPRDGFAPGLYDCVSAASLNAATGDGHELVMVLPQPAGGPLFLVRQDRERTDALDEARNQANEAMGQAKDAKLEAKIYKAKLDEAIKQRELAAEEAKLRVEDARKSEAAARERELELRERLVKYEESLTLYRAEVGRARQNEIEKEATELADIVLGPLKARSSKEAFGELRNQFNALLDHGTSHRVRYKGGGYNGVKLNEFLRVACDEAARRLGW